MTPSRVDFLIDLAYGALIFLAIVLILVVSTDVGVAFGLGALVAYVVHVAWKMARFDPDWMTREVTENVEETIAEELTGTVEAEVAEEITENVAESVEETVTREVAESVEETVTREVAESVEETGAPEGTGSVEGTVAAELDSVIDRLEEVNERIDRRPRAEGTEADGPAAERGGVPADERADEER